MFLCCVIPISLIKLNESRAKTKIIFIELNKEVITHDVTVGIMEVTASRLVWQFKNKIKIEHKIGKSIQTIYSYRIITKNDKMTKSPLAILLTIKNRQMKYHQLIYLVFHRFGNLRQDSK